MHYQNSLYICVLINTNTILNNSKNFAKMKKLLNINVLGTVALIIIALAIIVPFVFFSNGNFIAHPNF